MRTKMRLGLGVLLLSVSTLGLSGNDGANRMSTVCFADDACGVGGCPNGDCSHGGCCLGCQRVLDNKPIKKTIYSCKLVAFCLPGCRNPLQLGRTCCETCETHPRWKRVLLKKEIVVGYTCGTKCEVTCVTHSGACGCGCGQTATPAANGPPPAPTAYDAEPAPVPTAR